MSYLEVEPGAETEVVESEAGVDVIEYLPETGDEQQQE
jgi:hypothetical protein